MKTITEKPTSEGSTHMQWIYAILANMMLLSYGMQCGWISATAATLQSQRSPTGAPLTDQEVSWLASSPSLAAVLGVSLYACTVDRCGRKLCIISMGVLHTLGIVIKLCPASTSSLVAAQICGGLAASGGFNVVHTYVREISQDHIRGTLGTLLILCQNVGILAMFAMGSLGYHTVLWVALSVPALSTLLMTRAPESPAYLVKIGRVDHAAAAIASLRGLTADDKRVQNEIDSIKAEDDIFKSIPNVSFAGIFKHRAWRRGFSYMIVIMMLHGLNGGFTILTYASSLLGGSQLSVPAFMILGSLLSMTLVERLGRRVLLATSFIVSALAFCGLSAAALLQASEVPSGDGPSGEGPGWAAVACTITAVCAYAGGVSPLPFVLMSEMFTYQIRAKVMGCLVTLGWLFAFVQLAAFGPVARAFGPHAAFLGFAAVNSVGAAVVLTLLPETRARTLDQIQADLEKPRRCGTSLQNDG